MTVGGPRLTDDGLRHLAGMKKLDLLNIQGAFTDAGLRRLEALTSLRFLDLQTSEKISPQAVERLKGALRVVLYSVL